MPTYLERYQNGEYAQVWKELVSLGEQVWQEPLYQDAYAVAQETMRRARQNVQLLAERLKQLGFAFCEPDRVFIPPAAETLAQLQTFDREVGHVPLSLRAWNEVVGSVNFMGNYPRLCYYAAPSGDPLLNKIMSTGAIDTNDLRGFIQTHTSGQSLPYLNDQIVQDMQGQLNQMFANMQNAFQNLLGSDALGNLREKSRKNLENPIPELPKADRVMADPLVVEVAILTLEDDEWEDEDGPEVGSVASIAPDICHKSNFSGGGGYEIKLPYPAADAPLLNTDWGDLTFVEYLRLSFEWAGFPGLKNYEQRDETLLASLKEGLLPL